MNGLEISYKHRDWKEDEAVASTKPHIGDIRAEIDTAILSLMRKHDLIPANAIYTAIVVEITQPIVIAKGHA